jgi:hypothetical protein
LDGNLLKSSLIGLGLANWNVNDLAANEDVMGLDTISTLINLWF